MTWRRTFFLLVLILLPVAVFAAGADPATPTPAASGADVKFVALSNIPGLTDLQSNPTLPKFLNRLYQLAIGIAAVLAVLQIIRAGVMYMGESVSEKKEAKGLIQTSLLGLLLVLSPWLIFSIINPNILNLQLDVSGLHTANAPSLGDVVISATDAADCKKKGGTPTGSGAGFSCTAPAGSTAADSAYSCSNFGKDVAAVPLGGSCQTLAGENYSRGDSSCCAGIDTKTSQCCVPIKEPPKPLKTDSSLPATVYVFRSSSSANTGGDFGTVPEDTEIYNDFVSDCKTKGTLKKTYGSIVKDCTAAQLKAAPNGGKGMFCQNLILTCAVKK